MPDWKGFFSDPRTYQLSEKDLYDAYQALAASDTNMAEFSPEDHQAFFAEMQRQHNPNPSPENIQAVSEVAQTLSPLLGATSAEAEGIAKNAFGQVVGQEIAKDLPHLGLPSVIESTLEPLAEKIPQYAMSWATGRGIRGAQELGVPSQLLAEPAAAAQALPQVPGIPQPGMDLASMALKLLGGLPDQVTQAASNVLAGPAQQAEQLSQGLASAEDIMGPATKEVAYKLFGEHPEQTTKEALKSVLGGDLGAGAEFAWRGIVDAAVTSGPAALANAIPGIGPAVAGFMVLDMSLGEQAKQMRDAGVKEPPMVSDAVIPAVLEYLGMKSVFKHIPDRLARRGGVVGFLSGRAQNAAESAFGESLTELGQAAYQIYTTKQAQGIPFFPLTEEEKTDLVDSFSKAFIGGGAIGGTMGIVTRTPQEEKVRREKVEALFNQITKEIEVAGGGKQRVLKSPEELGAEGIVPMRGEAVLETGVARHSAVPKELNLTEAEHQHFVTTGMLTPEQTADVAARLGIPEADITSKVSAAEIAAQKMVQESVPPSQVAEPTNEGEEVLRTLHDTYEQMAVEQEELGNTVEADKIRAAASKIQIIEPRTPFQRAIRGLVEMSGKVVSAPKIVFYEQSPEVEAVTEGLLLRKGLIGIDITPGRDAGSEAVAGVVLHELFHETKRSNPDVYAKVRELLRSTPGWAESERLLVRRMPASAYAKLTPEQLDDEIMSTYGQLPNVAVNVFTALSDYQRVAKMAKEPGKFRAVVEWFTGLVRTTMERITGKGINVDEYSLKNLERINTLLVDPNAVRRVAGVSKAIVDMLGAKPVTPATPATPATPQAALTTREMRGLVGTTTPLGQSSILLEHMQAQESMDFVKLQEVFKAIVAGESMEEMKKTLPPRIKAAIEREIRNVKIIEPKEYTEEQKILSDFAKTLGAQVIYTSGLSPSLAGISTLPGTIFVNQEWSQDPVSAVFIHELLHDFKKRFPAAWNQLRRDIKKLPGMKDMWATVNDQIIAAGGYEGQTASKRDDEILARIAHQHDVWIWQAINAMGREKKAPAAYKKLFTWLGNLAKKGTDQFFKMFFRDIDGSKISTSDPEVVGMAIAQALSKMSLEEGQEYRAISLPEQEANLTDLKKVVEMRRGHSIMGDVAEEQLKELAAPEPAKPEAPEFSTRKRTFIEGFPPQLDTAAKVAKWRKLLAQAAFKGGEGQYWYQESARAILQIAQGDMELAARFAKVLAAYSPRLSVPPNWQRALTAWHRYLNGQSKEDFLKNPIGLKDQHKKAASILYDNAEWPGEKTNNFFKNLFALLDPTMEQGVTIDMWMMRLFGFPGDAPNPKQYEAMSRVVRNIASELGVQPYEAQAMMWVYAKSTWELLKPEMKAEAKRRGIITHVPALDKNGKPRIDRTTGKQIMLPTPEYQKLQREIFDKAIAKDLKTDVVNFPIKEEAITNFGTMLPRRVAALSLEFVPKIGVLDKVRNGSYPFKAAFQHAMEQTMLDENGANRISVALGFGPIDDGAFVGPSAYVNSAGEVEFNPATQLQAPTAAMQGAEASGLIDYGSAAMVSRWLSFFGKLYNQESVAAARIFEGTTGDRNFGVELKPGATLTLDQLLDVRSRIEEALKPYGATLGDVAYYPTRNGGMFVLIDQSKMDAKQFQEVIKSSKGDKLRGTVKSWGVETVYIEEKDYGKHIAGHEDAYRRVEEAVAPERDRVYKDFSQRKDSGEPQASQRRRTADVGESVYWHLSRAPVEEEGIRREFAGTGAAGEERGRLRVVDGKVDPESAVIHLYDRNARFEPGVVAQATHLNKIISKLKLIATDDPVIADIRDEVMAKLKSYGGPEVIAGVVRKLKDMGYDGLIDLNSGRIQVSRDISPEEIAEARKLTTEDRQAMRGSMDLEKVTPGERYDRVNVTRIVTHESEIDKIASIVTDDGTAFFTKDVDPNALRKYFGNVKPTSFGFAASNPVRVQFSVKSTDAPADTPVGPHRVVNDETEFGTQYARTSSAGWNLPHLNLWDWVVKRAADSIIQFKRLNDVIADRGLVFDEAIDVRLAEELFHGRAQERVERMYDTWITPVQRALGALASRKGLAYAHVLARFDEYLHAMHAPERNDYLKEAYQDRTIANLLKWRTRLEDKLAIIDKELQNPEGPRHKKSLENARKFYEMRINSVEKRLNHVRNRPTLDSGLTNDQAKQIMMRTRQEGLIDEFSRLAHNYVHPMLKERIENLKANGLIDQQTYNGISRYKYYVPLKGKGVEGDIEDMLDDFHAFGGGHGFDIRGEELPFATGREPNSVINPVYAQSVADTLRAIDRVERNKVAVALLELAEANPNDQLWEINKTVQKRVYDKKTGTIKEVEDWWARNQANVVAAKRGGETYYITLKDRGLAEAMRGLGVENLWKWVRYLRGAMRTVAKLFTTFSPDFVMSNFARDYQQALVAATTDMSKEAALRVARTSHKAARGILAVAFPDRFGWLRNEYSEFYEEMKEEGGKVGFFGMRGVDELNEDILKEIKSNGGVNYWRTMAGLRSLGRRIAGLNEVTENALRLATYVEARRDGASKAKAASLAKNVTVNFNRRGDVGGAIGAGYLFFNASVQGIDRFHKSMKTPAGKRLAAYYTGIAFLLSMFSRAIMGDDDDGKPLYDKISNFEHGRNWIIGIGKGEYVKIPMPYGFGIWAQLGKEMERAMFADEDRIKAATGAAVRMVEGLTTHFSPIGETTFSGSGYAMLRPVIPTLVEPWTDILANESYWGRPIYPEASPWDRRAASSRHYRPRSWTSKGLVALTEGLNRAFGGSEYRSSGPLTDINPEALSYLFETYLGPTGGSLNRLLTTPLKAAKGEDVWNDWIVLRRFLGETMPEYYVPGEFYDAVNDVEAAVDERKWLRKNGDAADVARWQKRHGWKPQLEEASRDAQERIRDLKKQDSQEAYDQILAIQRNFVNRYLQAERR